MENLNPDKSKYFPVSYFHNGNIETYGESARYLSGTKENAKYGHDDVISVQIGVFEERGDQIGFMRFFAITPPSPSQNLRVPSPEPKAEKKKKEKKDKKQIRRTPYCIFYKNGKMIYTPFVSTSFFFFLSLLATFFFSFSFSFRFVSLLFISI